MGLVRETSSVVTLGMVRPRSKKEKLVIQSKKQTKLQKQMLKEQRESRQP